MKLWIWILIILAVAAIAFFVGRNTGKCGCNDAAGKEVKDATPATKTGIDTEASKGTK